MEQINNDSSDDRVNELYKYLKSAWKLKKNPSLVQAKYELGYNISFEIGFKKIANFIDPFEEDIHRLKRQNKIILCSDHRKVKRIYPPEEKTVKELAGELYIFLNPIWEKTYIPRKIFVYEEFACKNNISRNQFEKAIILLKNFKLVETLEDSSNGIRIVKSLHSKFKVKKETKFE